MAGEAVAIYWSCLEWRRVLGLKKGVMLHTDR